MSRTMLAAVLHGVRDLRVEERPLPELVPGTVLLRVRAGSVRHRRPLLRGGPRRQLRGDRSLRARPRAVRRGRGRRERGHGASAGPARGGEPRAAVRALRLLPGRAGQPVPQAADARQRQHAAAHRRRLRRVPARRRGAVLRDAAQVDDGLGAMMEPFAVALQALARAGSVAGRRVIVSGGGPIGLLTVIAARAFGATTIALSDPVAERRQTGARCRGGRGARSEGEVVRGGRCGPDG